MSWPFPSALPALQRAADELAPRSDRFEVVAKVGETLQLRRRTGEALVRRLTREVGVGCRAVAGKLVGFGAAAGSDAGSGRDAARASLASLLPGPDPLPPRSLLGSVGQPALPLEPDFDRCEQFFCDLFQALRRGSRRMQLGEVRLLCGRSQTSLLTGEGFATGAEAAACAVEVVAAGDEGPWRFFHAAAPSPAHLDAAELAARIQEVTLLTARGSSPARALADVLLAPPVAAVLLAALAESILSGDLVTGSRAPRIASTWRLTDERGGPDGLLPLPFDGEGLPSRSIPLLVGGRAGGRAGTWADARRFGCAPGAALRPSYQQPPMAGPANVVVTSTSGLPAGELLQRLQHGVFAALPAGTLVLGEGGRFALPVAAVAVHQGRFAAAHPVAELRGSFRRLLAGLASVGVDTCSFSLSCAVTTPSLLVRTLEVG